MRVSKWWNKFHFGLNYPFNVTLEDFLYFLFEIFNPPEKNMLTWFENYLKLSRHQLLSCNRGLLLELSGAGPLWHNYPRAFCLTFTNGAVHPFRAWCLGGKCSRTRVQCGTSGGNEAIRFHLSEGHLTYMCCRKLDTFFLLPVCTDLSVSLLKMWVNAHILFLL